MVDRWHERLGQFDAAAAAYDSSSAALTEQQRFDSLARMDLLVAGLPLLRDLRPRTTTTICFGVLQSAGPAASVRGKA